MPITKAVPRSSPYNQGFTLIEVAIVICVVAILAGMLTPLTQKMLNQQRENKTRDILKVAFESCFGARDRRVANMRADFGFTPTTSREMSGLLTSSDAGTALPAYPSTGTGQGFIPIKCYWGWNGPYYQGSVDSNQRPLDAWGKPIKLQVTGSAPYYWQMQSSGMNQIFGDADDLLYPQTPACSFSYNATLILNLTKNGSSNYTGNATLTCLNGSSVPAQLSASPSTTITNTLGMQSFTWNGCAGAMQINLVHASTGNFTDQYFVFDLLPGETRTVDITL